MRDAGTPPADHEAHEGTKHTKISIVLRDWFRVLRLFVLFVVTSTSFDAALRIEGSGA